MSFNTALTSGQYNSLRGTASLSPSHQATLYISSCPNTVIYTARVNQSVFAASFAEVTYDTGSGTLADVLVGHTIFFSHTNDIDAAFFVGRIRKTPGASTFYINETSAPLDDNDYIFIVDDFRIWDKLGRYTGGALYLDYDLTFRQLLPRIYNLQSAYVVMTDGSDGEFDFAPGVSATTSGATISSYLWDVADGTITVGTATDKDITATFPPGFRWVHFTVTDSGSRASTRHIPVWVHDADNMPTLLDVGDVDVSASIDDGFSGSITAFDGISSLLNNTMVVAWLDGERYNGTLATIVNNIVLQGRLINQQDNTTYSDAQQDSSTRYDIEGPLQILSRLQMSSVEILSDSTPTAFCEVKDCTPWREIFLTLSEFSTFHELHSISFDDIGDTFADLGVVIPQGSLLNAVTSVTESINAHIQANPAGEIEIVRNAQIIDSADRLGLVTVANWTTVDILGIDRSHSTINTVGRLLGSGGSFNTTSRKIVEANSIAPGIAWDYPEGSTSLDRQVLTANLTKAEAREELNARAGHALAMAQSADELTITHPDGYWWLTPSINQWYTFTLDGSELVSGIVLDTSTRWLLISTNVVHNVADGTRDVSAVYRRETSGAPGQTIIYPTQSIAPLDVPDFPPLPAFPGFETPDFYLPDLPDNPPPDLAGTLIAAIKHDGNTVMVWSNTQVWLCSDFLTQLTPTWIDVTPPLDAGEIIQQVRFIPGTTPGALVLTTGGWSETFDFTESDGGWDPVNITDPTGPRASYSSGVGWLNNTFDPPGSSGLEELDEITITFVSTQITNISARVNWSYPTASNGSFVLRSGFTFVDNFNVQSAVGGWNVYRWAGSQTITRIVISVSDQLGQSMIIQTATVGGSGTNPFSGTPSADGHVWHKTNIFSDANDWTSGVNPDNGATIMRIGATFADVYVFNPVSGDSYYSSDYGATFAGAVNVGTPPASNAGFDTQRLGVVTMGGADGKVRIATSAGGAYSDYTSIPTDTVPTAIFIPRYKFSGSNNGVGVSAPDFLLGSADPESGTGYGLFKVTASGATVSNITPLDGAVNGLAVGPHCLTMPWYSTAYQDIMSILDFSGTRKLAVSIDSGASWELTGALSASADFLTTRRSDTRRKQLYAVNGVNLLYCSDYKTSPLILATRIGPSANTIIGIEVLP